MTDHFVDYNPWDMSLPRSFQSPLEEYRHWKNGTGVFDTSADGILRLRGKDCLSLLHRLSTNEVANLPEGRSIFTVLTSEKGRIIDSIQIIHAASGILVICSPTRRHSVAAWLDRYTIREDVRVEIPDDLASITVGEMGLSSSRLLSDHPLPDRDEIVESPQGIITARSELGIRIIGNTELIVDLHRKMGPSGIFPVGFEAMNYWRSEKRIPWWGTELTESMNPLEADLTDRISFKKGCYVGQEVIARLDTYNKVQRHLVLLELDSAVSLPAVVSVDGKDIGWITSMPETLKSYKIICLSYIKTPFCQFDGELSILSTNSQQKLKGAIRKV